jgi:glycosyltransferase involved in cell wall biosynthesis
MKILHIEMTGGLGGIQTLTRDILKYSDEDNEIYYLKQGGIISEQIVNYGGKVFTDESVNFKSFTKKAQTLFNFINKNCFDVLVFHDAGIISLKCLKLIKRNNKKIICYVYEHDDVFSIFNKKGIKNFIYKHILISSLKVCDGIICISKFVLSQGQRIYKNKKSSLVYNGIDLNVFKPSNNYNIKAKTIELLFVGRIVREKGVDTLVKALVAMKGVIDFHLTIVGGGDDEKTVSELIEKNKLKEKIEIKSPTTNVVEYYQKADFFVHPAIWNEGFGITLVEALACGVPCIGPKTGAIPEIIRDDENGFLFESNSQTSLEAALKKAFDIKSTNKYSEMRKKSAFSSLRFDINNTIKNLESLFRNDLEKIGKE